MTIDSTGTTGINRIRDATGDERAALEGMLKGYPVDQLVEEVLIAWNELAARNEEMVSVKQRLRVVELDLAEREDMVAPEISRLNQASTIQYVPQPTMAKRDLTITSLGNGWDVIEAAYRFQAPEQAISTEQRMIELHPTFAPRCP